MTAINGIDVINYLVALGKGFDYFDVHLDLNCGEVIVTGSKLVAGVKGDVQSSWSKPLSFESESVNYPLYDDSDVELDPLAECMENIGKDVAQMGALITIEELG